MQPSAQEDFIEFCWYKNFQDMYSQETWFPAQAGNFLLPDWHWDPILPTD